MCLAWKIIDEIKTRQQCGMHGIHSAHLLRNSNGCRACETGSYKCRRHGGWERVRGKEREPYREKGDAGACRMMVTFLLRHGQQPAAKGIHTKIAPPNARSRTVHRSRMEWREGAKGMCSSAHRHKGIPVMMRQRERLHEQFEDPKGWPPCLQGVGLFGGKRIKLWFHLHNITI